VTDGAILIYLKPFWQEAGARSVRSSVGFNRWNPQAGASRRDVPGGWYFAFDFKYNRKNKINRPV